MPKAQVIISIRITTGIAFLDKVLSKLGLKVINKICGLLRKSNGCLYRVQNGKAVAGPRAQEPLLTDVGGVFYAFCSVHSEPAEKSD